MQPSVVSSMEIPIQVCFEQGSHFGDKNSKMHETINERCIKIASMAQAVLHFWGFLQTAGAAVTIETVVTTRK